MTKEKSVLNRWKRWFLKPGIKIMGHMFSGKIPEIYFDFPDHWNILAIGAAVAYPLLLLY
jgi:hypothetical protein